MAKHEVTSPDGQVFEVDAPDGATENEIIDYAKRNFGMVTKAQTTEPSPSRAIGDILPNVGVSEAVLSGLTGAVATPIAGLTGLAATMLPGGRPGLGKDAVEAVQSALTYEPRSRTGKAIIGGVSAPFEWLANKGSQAGGAYQEAITPIFGEAAGEVFGTGLETAVNMAPALISPLAKAVGPFKGVNPRVAVANEKGFALTPHEMGAGPLARGMAGLAGEPMLGKSVSAKNAPKVDKIIADDVKMAAESITDIDAINAAISDAGKVYEPVRSMGMITTSPQYFNDLANIIKEKAKAEFAFPSKEKSPIFDYVDNLRQAKVDADAMVSKLNEVRADAKKAYAAGDWEQYGASKQAALAMEKELARHAKAIGAPDDVVGSMVKARETQAKLYDTKEAIAGEHLNPQTFFRKNKGGDKLSGGSKDVAELAQYFPKSFQNPRPIAATGATATDLALAAIRNEWKSLFLRPLARDLLSSRAGQEMMMAGIRSPEQIRGVLANPAVTGSLISATQGGDQQPTPPLLMRQPVIRVNQSVLNGTRG